MESPSGIILKVLEVLTLGWALNVVLNVAVTLFAAVMDTMQLVPVHAPDHPANIEPEFAVAVSVTDVPLINE